MINELLRMFVDQDSPSVSDQWRNSSPEVRLGSINKALRSYESEVEIIAVDALADGQVYLSFESTPSVSERGKILLDLEDRLKDKIERGITVWVNPLGDRSALRKLRGVNIQKIKNEE